MSRAPNVPPPQSLIAYVTGRAGVTDVTTGIENDPRWSTGGIAFTANADGTPRLYRINPDGTGLTQLSRGSTPSYEPAWKPDRQP